MSTQRPRIGEMLLESGAITQAQLDQALEEQQRSGRRLGLLLVSLGFIDQATLAKTLAAQLAATIDRFKEEAVVE